MKANLAETAELLGLSLPTLKKYLTEGMPFEQKGAMGKPWVLDVARCITWLRETDVKNAVGDVSQADVKELQKRKLAAETTLAEIEAAKKRGEIILIADAIKIRTAEALAVKASLLAIPVRIDHVLAATKERKKCKEILADEIGAALSELATRSITLEDVFPSEDDGDSADSLGAATKPNAKRVGGTKRKNTGRKRAPRKN